MIDLDELERLLDEDIDLNGEKLTATGTQVLLTDSVKYAHAFAKNNDFWLASVRARLIAAACNAVPELIAENRALRERIRELEQKAQNAEALLGDCQFMRTLDMRRISELKAELRMKRA